MFAKCVQPELGVTVLIRELQHQCEVCATRVRMKSSRKAGSFLQGSYDTNCLRPLLAPLTSASVAQLISRRDGGAGIVG